MPPYVVSRGPSPDRLNLLWGRTLVRPLIDWGHCKDGRITFSHGWEIISHWLAERIINTLISHKSEALT